VPARHNGAFHQDRDDPHVAGQGRLDFQPDNVLGLSNRRAPRSSAAVSQVGPMIANLRIGSSVRWIGCVRSC
jgi:hypothetical protein